MSGPVGTRGPQPAPPRPASSAEIDAPAKVNLALRVLDRDQATGYHRLETVFQAVALSDHLRIERGGSGVVLDVAGADVGPARENLVVRATRAFLRRAGSDPGLRIRLDKHIPAGAGLGGGSSDAAATLRALNALFGEPLARQELHEIALTLGADVPFFLCGSPTAVGRGRGDRLRPLPPLPPRPALVILPDVRVGTGGAYEALARARAESGHRPGTPRLGQVEALDWSSVAADAVNDFEAVVPVVYPVVALALAAARATGPRVALLSGSGSAVFAVYEGSADAAAARASLEGEGHRVVETRTLERMPEPVLRAG